MSDKIKLVDLRAVFSRIVDHLESKGISEVEICSDYYWEVPEEILYSPETNIPGLMLGQISSDWDDLKDLLSGEDEPIAYGFVWLSSILRAIGQQIVD